MLCTEYSLRLVSQAGATSTNQSTGRLEIFINSQWGTVCDDFFGFPEANVACNQLGFPAGASTHSNAEVAG
jgi:deleted-in-malignant-brain-tumors protein 1